MAEITIYDTNDQAYRFGLVAESQLPSGRRNMVRSFRATNASDPGRIRVVSWEISGPIGNSQESLAGVLATDYVQNLDTRALRRLTAKGLRTAVTLTTKDPVGVSNTNKLGQFYLGDVSSKLGGALSTSDNVTHFAEYNGYLYAYRGRLGTQVQISGWTVIATAIFPEAVSGVVKWFDKVRVGLGSSAAMRTLVAASATGSVYEPQSTLLGDEVIAGPLAVGSDRCWYVTRAESGELENLVSYTLNDFETVANPFQVGDPRTKINGLGTYGPFMAAGNTNGINTFTDQARKVPLSDALRGHTSTNNGIQFANPGWGWLYAITDIGLRAMTSHIDNPVGPGEAMRQFNGHNGRPTAIWAERGEMFVVYLTTAGDLYAYRCTFGPQTAQTGQPDFYPWWYKASSTCSAVFSTNATTNTTLVWGEGTNMAYETISRDGRDDLFTSRTYDTGGGTWYGTLLDRDPHMLKVLRLNRVHVKNSLGSTWTIGWSFDGGSYIDLPEILENGYHTVRPVQDDVDAPLGSINGRTMKPRIVLVADSGITTTSPEIAGTLEVEYDERPELIEEVACTVQLGATGRNPHRDMELLEELASSTSAGPLKIRLDGDRGDHRWAMLATPTNRRDLKDPNVEAVDIILQVWETS